MPYHDGWQLGPAHTHGDFVMLAHRGNRQLPPWPDIPLSEKKVQNKISTTTPPFYGGGKNYCWAVLTHCAKGTIDNFRHQRALCRQWQELRSLHTGRGGRISRAWASRVGDQDFGSPSSQINDL